MHYNIDLKYIHVHTAVGFVYHRQKQNWNCYKISFILFWYMLKWSVIFILKKLQFKWLLRLHIFFNNYVIWRTVEPYSVSLTKEAIVIFSIVVLYFVKRVLCMIAEITKDLRNTSYIYRLRPKHLFNNTSPNKTANWTDTHLLLILIKSYYIFFNSFFYRYIFSVIHFSQSL